MARTIAEVITQIKANMAQQPNLQPLLANTSSVSIWGEIVYCFAYAIVSLEQLYDLHKAEILAKIALMKPHTRRWYQSKALAYQHGGTLLIGDDQYDNSALNDTQIEAQKIIKRAAVVEENTTLTVKVAKLNGTAPVPLLPAELAAFKDYIEDIKDAGVKIKVITAQGDALQLEIDIYYDPSIMGVNGALLDGSSVAPVETAVHNFLSLLPFNGVFFKSALVDAIQNVQGVVTPVVNYCVAAPFGAASSATVNAYYESYAGYLTLYDQQSLTLNYIPYHV
jgi:hypothetical protein